MQLTRTDDIGRNPLYLAAQFGILKLVELFVNTEGSEINESGEKGKTPLHIACFNGHFDVVKFLIESGADPNIHDELLLWTPIFYAVVHKHYDILKYMIRKENIDLNASDSQGRSPLWIAAMKGYCDVIAILLMGNTDINLCDDSGRTPLYIATQMHQIDAMILLIEEGCDLDIRDSYERPILLLAYKLTPEYDQEVQLLIDSGADQTCIEMERAIDNELEKPNMLYPCNGKVVESIDVNLRVLCWTREDTRLWAGTYEGYILVWDIEVYLFAKNINIRQMS
eukprot:TRINITY_DN2815_c0_g1_i2.p1 TRINITY_DN2815_c0_g1~~TRINITY_DN2815_c0_g1_i2.p1  ORF type:complete len:320 (+),score=60.23 TRINITY_DN2815_c0_g1_i2:115-960(+)